MRSSRVKQLAVTLQQAPASSHLTPTTCLETGLALSKNKIENASEFKVSGLEISAEARKTASLSICGPGPVEMVTRCHYFLRGRGFQNTGASNCEHLRAVDNGSITTPLRNSVTTALRNGVTKTQQEPTGYPLGSLAANDSSTKRLRIVELAVIDGGRQ